MRMSLGILLLFFIMILSIAGCQKAEIQDDSLATQTGEDNLGLGTPSGGTNADDLGAQAEDRCPESCDDQIVCTTDTCSESTGFECSNEYIADCCGNGVCEVGETTDTCADDCEPCETSDVCKTAEFNYETGQCDIKTEKPCCGNGKCEIGETAAECSDDCTALTKDLSAYPGFLDGKVIIGVGDKGKGQDIFAASTIANALLIKGKTTETLIRSKISSLSSQDMIIIGRPCENSLWDDFLGMTECDGFQPANTGIIKLVEKNGHEYVFMGADTSDNTQKLADVLANPSKYSGLKGGEVKATFSGDKITLG